MLLPPDITISLTFLHSMTNHDAIQLSANRSVDTMHLQDDTGTLLGSQHIDTDAPLALYSSLSFVISLYFLFLTSFFRQPTPGLGSSVRAPHPEC